MEEQTNHLRKHIVPIVYVFYIVGIAGHLIDAVRPFMLSITPFALLAWGIAVLYFPVKESGKKLVFWIVCTYVVTFMLEAIGVATGAIFGDYAYGSTLGLRFLDVPLIIGFNWVAVILGAIAIVNFYISTDRLGNVLPVRIAVTGVLAVVFDMVLEPVAIELDYWQWSGGSIPLQNYAAWFLIAASASAGLSAAGLRITHRVLRHYVYAQFLFFCTLNLLTVSR